MKQTPQAIVPAIAIASLLLFSCQKSATSTSATNDHIAADIASQQAVAVGSTSASADAEDSIYVIHACDPGERLDSVAFASLPTAAATYLTDNYAGYTLQKVLAIQNASGETEGYVVLIQYNGTPVGLRFDKDGNFKELLEQREGRDLIGRGWHIGGRFGSRGGASHDTINLSSLPVAVLTYFTTNYLQDTLVTAFQVWNGGYVVISKNNALYATVFDSSATFVKRVQLPAEPGIRTPVAESSLSSNIQAYLTATYSGYVFEHAYSVSKGGVIVNYVTIIQANNMHYAVVFDGSGNFISAITLR